MAKLIQSSFARGEIAPALYGRVDTRQYQIALRRARNMFVHQFGGISNRPGTQFIGPVKDHTRETRLIPFQFKTTDTHILEFGHEYIRFIRNDAHITESSFNISAATQASPVVVTTATHSYTNGDEVFIEGVVGMTEINGQRFVIANKTATTFELTSQADGTDIDGTGFTAYSSAGTSARIYTVATTYQESELRDLSYVQTADVVTIAHPAHDPAELARLALANWTLTDITFRPEVAFPRNIAATGGSDAVASSFKVTAISDTDEESLAGLGDTPAQIAITGITQANPAVVTVTSNAFENGDVVYIENIVGMTELNDRQFTVANQATNTIELLGEDSSTFTAWSSAGTVDPTFIEHTNGDDVVLSWDSVATAVRYRIFRLEQGVFGFIGSTEATTFTDDNTASADLDDTPPRLVEPFLGADNRPAAVGFHQQRRVLGGSNNKPDTTFYSVIGSFDNFSKSTPIKADDGFSVTLSSQQVNAIRHFVSQSNLLIFTSGTEWAVTSGGEQSFSADTIFQNPQTNWGSSVLPPITVGNTVLFSQDTGGSIRSVKFALEIDGYTTSDLSILVPHLLSGVSFLEWGFTRANDPIIYIVKDDGDLLLLTFNEEQEVVAWTTWDTAGKYESVAAIRPSISSTFDAAYFVIQRNINGNPVRYIERNNDRTFTDVRDAFFVDSGLSLDSPFTITASTAASPVVVTTSAVHGLVADDEVDIEGITWITTQDVFGNTVVPDQLNGKRFKVKAAPTTTSISLKSVEDDTDIDGSSYATYVEGGKVRQAVSALTGFFHLPSTAVTVLADGNVISNLTVAADGSLTLPRKFSRVHVGLPYVSDIETLNIEVPATGNSKKTIQAQQKKISEVVVRFEKSRGLLIGPNEDDMVEMKQREFELLGDPTDLLTGDKRITIPPAWNSNGRLVLRQINPLPLTILAIIPEIDIGER